MTFLDLVRAIAKITFDGCDIDCDTALHRREAALHLSVLLRRPDLVQELARKCDEREAYLDQLEYEYALELEREDTE